MMLGATHGAMLSALIMLLEGILLGTCYVIPHFLRLISKKGVLRFIYDLLYAILVGGIFVMTMLKMNMLDIKYYHILALIIGIMMTAIPLCRAINSRREFILNSFGQVMSRMRESKLYHIIKK